MHLFLRVCVFAELAAKAHTEPHPKPISCSVGPAIAVREKTHLAQDSGFKAGRFIPTLNPKPYSGCSFRRILLIGGRNVGRKPRTGEDRLEGSGLWGGVCSFAEGLFCAISAMPQCVTLPTNPGILQVALLHLSTWK